VTTNMLPNGDVSPKMGVHPACSACEKLVIRTGLSTWD
jgi:hypothetical protein